ncbi:MAG TPA: N-6 DNA methylase [Pyrinomonadaceae bacterium]
MKPQVEFQRLPASGPKREALRSKGQFWTPDWVAEAMVAYAISGDSDSIFDPAVGAGAFFRAAKKIERERGLRLDLHGTEVDPDALHQAERGELATGDLANVTITDFVLSPPQGSYKAIVANPPYIRHHRLPLSVKSQLKIFSRQTIGVSLDGRAGLHVYFLIRALRLLKEDGRLAFIMPADTCEGIFAPVLWKWITTNYRLEAVITFTPEASPFPNVDTNPLIFLIRNSISEATFKWAQVRRAGTDQLKEWMSEGLTGTTNDDLYICYRDISEGITTGLSRPPTRITDTGLVLADFASVLRGIATGANEFFFLTRQRASELNIPSEFLLPAIGRTRDISADQITPQLLEDLDKAGRPTLLFAPNGREIKSFTSSMREYLLTGQEAGLNKRPLIAQRRPWYKMEKRRVPPILFAYLGRRNARFIRNFAGVIPLTGFLCVYPHKEENNFIDKLWKVLRHPETVANLNLVGKSYGDGAIKVEPRALEKLPLPLSVVAEAELRIPARVSQLALL